MTTHKKTYRAWWDMRQRCLNQKHKNYKDYGARGITICKSWDNFADFLKDMSDAPSGLSLDRIDNDGPYCKSNCRWVDSMTQQRNTRRNRLIEYNGEFLCVTAWAQRLGARDTVISERLRRGWTPTDAVSIPVMAKFRAKQKLAF